MQKSIAKSLNKNAELAVKEIKEQFSNVEDICCIIFFVSYHYNSNEIAAAMSKYFSDVDSFGTISHKEIFTDGITEHSLVATAFTSDLIEDYHIEIVEKLNEGPDLQPTIDKFASHYGSPLRYLEADKYFGLVLLDWNSKAEEKLFNELCESVHLIFLGASCSSTFTFSNTGVYFNGKYYNDAAIISLFKPKVKFSFEKINVVEEICRPLLVTKSDLNNKILYEIEGRPAAELYCELVGLDYNSIARDDNDIIKEFIKYPLGIKIENDIYLRDILRINKEDKSLIMLINIPEGLNIHFFKIPNGDDIISNMKTQLEQIKNKYNKKINYMINFSCYNVLMDVIREDKIEEFSSILREIICCAGFFTYGEYYTVPVNHTMTLLIFFDD